MFSMCVSLDSKNLEKSHDFHGGMDPMAANLPRHRPTPVSWCCVFLVDVVLQLGGSVGGGPRWSVGFKKGIT